jgi:hypothetical protein
VEFPRPDLIGYFQEPKLLTCSIFPCDADGGFCCDQIVQYVPSIDRFIRLQQFWRGSEGSGIRSEAHHEFKRARFLFPLNRVLHEALQSNQERLLVTFVPVGILINGKPSRPEAKSPVRIGKANLQVEIRKEGVKGKTGKEN